jgi:transglutaminase superfamily protein
MTAEANGAASVSSAIGPHEWHLNTTHVSQLLVWKACLALLAFDLFGFGRSFSNMHRYMRSVRRAKREPSKDAVDRVCTAVNYACVWYPKRVLCLQRSAVTTWLLRHRGVQATMVMGCQALPFKAHAWTEVDGRPVNERRHVRDIYQVWERC